MLFVSLTPLGVTPEPLQPSYVSQYLHSAVQDHHRFSGHQMTNSFFFFVLNFYLFIYFNWRLITLQYCGCFCHTSTLISIRYTYVPSFLNHPTPPPPPPPSRSYSSRLSQSFGFLCHTSNSHWLSILHMVMCMFQCYFPKSSHPLLPTLCSKCLCLLCCPAAMKLEDVYSLEGKL